MSPYYYEPNRHREIDKTVTLKKTIQTLRKVNKPGFLSTMENKYRTLSTISMRAFWFRSSRI